MNFAWFSDPQAWVALLTLTVLEIVLGIDNIIFISILSGKLPKEQRLKAQRLGLGLALITRLMLLFSLSWVMSLKDPLLTISQFKLSGRDLILLAGGIFLIWKAVHEIHQKLEGAEHEKKSGKVVSFSSVIWQILVLDIVFSLDSVITAVGMAKHLEVMIIAVVIAMIFMLAFAPKLSEFVDKHPTIKILALAFLILIGVNLVSEGFHQHIEKGYTYFAMAFATAVELINLRVRSKAHPVELHNVPRLEDGEKA